MPARANSAYASSTTTMPGRCLGDRGDTASITSSGSAVPVGLFGEHRNTTSGRCSRDRGDGPLRVEPEVRPSRGTSIHPVPLAGAMSGCIEYDGLKPSAVRPGPPKACRSCCSISLEPLPPRPARP